jgi:putative ABC transport system permease protein
VQLNLGTAFAQALFNLIQTPTRTGFMALTLGAGAAAACLSTAILDGFGEEVERMAFGAYARSIVISENLMVRDRFGPPRTTDLEKLTTAFGDDLDGAAIWRSSRVMAIQGGEQLELQLLGMRGDYRFEVDMELAQGRFLTEEELNGAGRVCMLGSLVAARLFPGQVNPVGASVRLNGVACDIVGVFQPATTRTSERYAYSVFTSFDAAGRYFEATPLLTPIEASQITLVFKDRDAARLARSDADRILRRAHGAPMSQSPPFSFADPAAPTRAVVRQRNLLEQLLWSVAAVTLIGAAIGYAGFTSTTVDMRRRDIALQISAGAMRGDILVQYWLESMMIGAIGGVTGLCVGFAASHGLASVADVPISIQPGFAVVALLSGAGAGALAGLWPAWRASSAPPALAVRQ